MIEDDLNVRTIFTRGIARGTGRMAERSDEKQAERSGAAIIACRVKELRRPFVRQLGTGVSVRVGGARPNIHGYHEQGHIEATPQNL